MWTSTDKDGRENILTKYETIMNYIENEITSGNIKQGQKLPSIRDVSEKFSCSKVTVTKSYDLLFYLTCLNLN